jgi:hypothetical protein
MVLGIIVVEVAELLVFFADEARDEGGPSGLVGGPEAFAGFGVEVFVKEEVLIPEGIAAMGMMGTNEVA